jgi:hypothetical protein
MIADLNGIDSFILPRVDQALTPRSKAVWLNLAWQRLHAAEVEIASMRQADIDSIQAQPLPNCAHLPEV